MALSLQRYTYESYCNPTFLNILKRRNQKERERSSLITITLEDGLPECLIIEILSWLPVKSLLQFKSVCKSWYSIITSPHFIPKHVQNYYNNSQELCLLAQYFVRQREAQLTELLVDETPHVLAYKELYARPLYPSFVCGPCDGLYYVYRNSLPNRALWNPAINELKPLPRLIEMPNLQPNMYCDIEFFGFGIDLVTKDYKVVVVQSYLIHEDDEYSIIESDPPSSIFVYSLRPDSWKYCGDLSQRYEMQYNKCHVFVHGCCYWLSNYENPDVLVSFDMATDAFQEFQVPYFDNETYHKRLGIYDDSLALFTFHMVEQNLDIWIFNDENWSMKLSVGPLCDIVDVIGHWKDNKLFLQGRDCKLVVYDTYTHEMKDLGFQGDEHGYDGVYVYKESLVSIDPENRWRYHDGDETDYETDDETDVETDDETDDEIDAW